MRKCGRSDFVCMQVECHLEVLPPAAKSQRDWLRAICSNLLHARNQALPAQEETLTRDTVLGHRGLEQIQPKDVAPQNRIARNSETISPNASAIRGGEGRIGHRAQRLRFSNIGRGLGVCWPVSASECLICGKFGAGRGHSHVVLRINACSSMR